MKAKSAFYLICLLQKKKKLMVSKNSSPVSDTPFYDDRMHEISQNDKYGSELQRMKYGISFHINSSAAVADLRLCSVKGSVTVLGSKNHVIFS